jgi:tetratricopeptide (TPR) repeat protein
VKKLGTYGLGIAVMACAAVAWWYLGRPAERAKDAAGVDGAQPVEAVEPLMARLAIETGAPGDEALGIVSLFDGRLRNRVTTEGALVTFSQAQLDAGMRIEIEQPDGAAAAGPLVSVVRAPAEAPIRMEASTTLEVWVTMTALPPAGQRIRASVPVSGRTVTTDWVTMPAVPAALADQLAARARIQQMRGTDTLAATADALVAQAPEDARGYYYRGLALEARGDRAGAITAYEAALERTPNNRREPPSALYRRLARLRRAP